MASAGAQPIMHQRKIATIRPDQPIPVANQRPQNHSATTAKKATR